MFLSSCTGAAVMISTPAGIASRSVFVMPSMPRAPLTRTVANEVQPLNALSAMEVTEVGMVMEVSERQP